MKEIERKFLPKQLPENLHRYKKEAIIQGYISSDPVLRLRRIGDKYVFTFKNGISLIRDELESSITKEQFENLWRLVSGYYIIKDRHYIPLEDGFVAELDIYHDRLKGLATVEVEFNSEEEANTFIPPDWFGKDVTYDQRYSNSSLSKGIPPPFQ